MKLVGLLLLLASSARANFLRKAPSSTFSTSIRELSSTTTSCPILTTDGSISIDLVVGTDLTFNLIPSESGTVCTLTKQSSSGIVPVARSYNGKVWERVSGPFSSSLSFDCKSANDSPLFCEVALPELSDSGEEKYVITTAKKTRTPFQRAARFLEHTTFGPRKDEIEELLTPESCTSTWMHKQMYNTPMSLHREYYRSRADDRRREDESVGVIDSPCAANSRWRQAFYTNKDRNRQVTITPIDGHDGWYGFEVDGFLRTTTNNITTENTYTEVDPNGGTYDMCGNQLYLQRGKFPMRFDGKCRNLLEVPLIHLVHDSLAEGRLIDIPYNFDSSEFTTLGSTAASNYGREVVLSESLTSSVCTNLQEGLDPRTPIFGKTKDGVYLLYDPHILLKTNTPDKLISDGGGSTQEETDGKVLCASAPRTFLNEDTCKLSTEASACDWNDAGGTGFATVVCGSPGEVSNTPLSYFESFEVAARDDPTESNDVLEQQRDTIWTMNAVYSPDQLRQRVAWALSQIYAISPGSLVDSIKPTEQYMTYYDIFVRHAFGNLRDILREVSYSPIMGEMLGYVKQYSAPFKWQSESEITFADENFAREVMQLFSIGLIRLKADGTPDLDESGKIVETYSNLDITSYSRAWTGLFYSDTRANVEDRNIRDGRNDPMRVEFGQWRDHFPKTDLSGGYLGDKYPLCVELPRDGFLSKGSSYRLLGSKAQPDFLRDEWFSTGIPDDYVVLEEDSALYQVLCNKDEDEGTCQYSQTTITLPAKLDCSGAVECGVDTLRVVQVGEMYFEYVRPACVQLAFYENAQTIRGRWGGLGSLCANPLLPDASEACCNSNNLKRAFRNCTYTGERMKASTAAARCTAGRVTCDFISVNKSLQKCEKHAHGYHWRKSSCALQVKISPEGQIALVHSPGDTDIEPNLKEEALNFFSAYWSAEGFPTSANNECGGCTVMTSGDCLCDTTVKEEAVFNSEPSSAAEVLSRLFIGVNEGVFDPTQYSNTLKIDDNLEAYYNSASCCDEDTVFKATDAKTQRVFILKNVESTVTLDGTDLPFSFRNPPHFISFMRSDRTIRDAQYETEAVLDSYFYHNNIGPFIGIRLCQRFGFSNPSPNFVERITKAFETGTFTPTNGGGPSFGSGKYGDLAAMVAAVLLDEEATTDYLDMDPSHGSVREPLLKYIHVLRSLEFKSFGDLNLPFIELSKLDEKIGQMAHAIPTVFSFFLTDYSPPGVVSNAGLVSPEAQLLTTPKTVALMNGLYSLIKSGLTFCNYGFSVKVPGVCSDATDGGYGASSGKLEYVPPTDIGEALEEMFGILTAGRMTETNADIISNIVNEVAANDLGKAMRLAQQLIVSTPEFHANSIPDTVAIARPVAPTPSEPTKAYKAVIHFMLAGGVDSFQLLVPHSGCEGKDLYEEYKSVRGSIALNKDKLKQIDVEGQVCTTFGLHNKMPFLKDLYDDKHLVFVANVGVMTKDGLTKENHRDETVTRLFAHDAMQREIKTLDPHVEFLGTSPLGRFADAVTDEYAVRACAIDTTVEALTGRIGVAPPVYSVDKGGAIPYNEEESIEGMEAVVRSLNGESGVRTGLFSEVFSKSFMGAIDQSELLVQTLENTKLTEDFESSSTGKKLEVLAKMIKARRSMGAERDVFYVEMGGFDTHDNVINRLDDQFTELNAALKTFVKELKEQEVWESVTIIETSDFGRTLSPNTKKGTDHAWGGNMFVMGGGLDGGKILGEFPRDLALGSELVVGRGRMIPTTPFDSVFKAVAEWFGVPVSKMKDVLPNIDSFVGRPLLTKVDLYGGSSEEDA